MHTKLTSLLLVSLLTAAACSRHESAAKRVNACELLSSPAISAVQGEEVAETKGSERSNNSLATSQCFYRLPTYSKSVSLDVMQTNGEPEAIEEYWDRHFHNENGETEAEREREMSGKAEHGEEREEENAARPQPVGGLGDEAFWSGTQINGSLYMRKGDTIIRLSLGGPEDQSTKIQRAKDLVEQAIKHL